MSNKLLPVCTYQGGKQRIASGIADIIEQYAGDLRLYDRISDVCCGSGAVSLELMTRGVSPSQLWLVDAGPWGEFWEKTGSGQFDTHLFEQYLALIPDDKTKMQAFAKVFALNDAAVDTVYQFLILQSLSFGGKQIWRDGSRWMHSGFRNYWQPTENSVRRSACNPMQPGKPELMRRVNALCNACLGVHGFAGTANSFIESNPILSNSLVYVDPPYVGTTAYGYDLDVVSFAEMCLAKGASFVFVSEGKPLGQGAVRLAFGGPKGGISGKKQKGEEWLTIFKQ